MAMIITTYHRSKSARSSAPERVVDLVDHVRGTDRAVVEAATVETLESFLTTRDRVELHVNVAFGVGVDSDVNDLAVLLVTLNLDFGLKIFDPVITPGFLFPVEVSAFMYRNWRNEVAYSSASKAFSILMHFEAIGLSTTGTRGLLTTG